MEYWLGVLGCIVTMDGIYSWTLYLHAPSYENNRKQTFWRDHWVRLLRIIVGITLIWMGAVW